VIVDAHRLHRQVDQAVRVVETVSVKHVRYPRGLGFLPSIREAILSDLHKSPRAPGDPVF
jgi:hypothetical protein